MSELINSQSVQKLRQRFCKDTNIPIKVYVQPYFESRLQLFEEQFGAKTKYEAFVKEVAKFHTEQAYFEFYNKVKDAAIEAIKATEGYERFNSYDMNNFKVDTHNISRKDIFHKENNGKKFISVDLAKGNFTAMKWFDKDIFNGADTYGEFIARFAEGVEHIITSKYIRQVIFGNCNPRRQTTIEKYLIGLIIENVIIREFGVENIECFTDDEVVIKVPDEYSVQEFEVFEDKVRSFAESEGISIHCDLFTLRNIRDTGYYFKEYIKGDEPAGSKELKCVDALAMPFVLRALKSEGLTEEDIVFVHEGKLAKFMELPTIEL